VLAVGIDVGEIVKDVDRARDQAEQGKACQRIQQRGQM
jgi:hypothetical protein